MKQDLKKILEAYNDFFNFKTYRVFGYEDPDKLLEENPEEYYKRKEELMKSSKLYSPEKDNKLEMDSGYE